jgi:hypothetical protein
MLQAHQENAPECLTMTHYIDLKEKGLVLMRGEYNKDVLVSITGKPFDSNFTSLILIDLRLGSIPCGPDAPRP